MLDAVSSARKEGKEEGKLEANPTPSGVLLVPAEGGDSNNGYDPLWAVPDLGLAPSAPPSIQVSMVSK